jgi:hypothetical protein
MRRGQQLPWRRHHAVLAKLDMVRTARPKQTLNGEYRPTAEVRRAAKQTLNV